MVEKEREGTEVSGTGASFTSVQVQTNLSALPWQTLALKFKTQLTFTLDKYHFA